MSKIEYAKFYASNSKNELANDKSYLDENFSKS